MQFLIILAVIIVVVLASYAAYLLLQLRRKQQGVAAAKQAQLDAAKAKKQQILTDIRYIAQAMLEERCEVSEGVVRIARLFDLISLTDLVKPKYPALFSHYDVIASHPIMEERKKLKKQERMKLDLARMKSENQHQLTILEEAKQLSQFSETTH